MLNNSEFFNNEENKEKYLENGQNNLFYSSHQKDLKSQK
jgi:hypothetical protein